MIKSILLRSFLGFFLGLCLLPATISVVGLYAPFLAGVDPLFGDLDVENFLFAGYVLSAMEVSEFHRLSRVLNDLAQMGLLVGLSFGLIGAISAWSDYSKASCLKSHQS